jgi:SSS family solute:Na+ symporter
VNAALFIIAVTTLAALALGLRARRGREMDLEQWTVAGRGFGTALVFLLMAGEIYTTFTFLGGSGWAYGRGAPAYYILAYACLAYVLSYWLLPALWRYATAHRLVSQPQFFAHKYESPALGALVALVGIAALLPYLVLQVKGLGIIVAAASYGTVSSTWAGAMGAIVTVAYVMVSGVRGSAWMAVAKDILILAIVVFLGLYLPIHYAGGIGRMFAAIEAAKPGFLALPAQGQNVAWYVSTVALTALGFFMWPHTFASLYTARDERIFRRNAVILPLYQLILLFVMFVGFTALIEVPDLKGADADLALLRLSIKSFDPWFVGIIGAAGVLTALVPGSMIMMATATLAANDLYRLARPAASTDEVALLAKLIVPMVAIVAVAFAVSGSETIVTLLLMGYSLVTQLFPALILSLGNRRRVTAPGAMAGIAAGVATVAALSLTHSTVGSLLPMLPAALHDLNVGFVALAVNVVALLLVTWLTHPARFSKSAS